MLLHIGPHKTGTTALQGALKEARKDMKKHGVVYAGRERQHQLAAIAVTGGRGLAGDPPAEMRHWERLVKQVNDVPDKRVIVSSEFFNAARGDRVREIVERLGGERVHVLVTLRPLHKIMPSAWQQHIRNRLEVGYDEWLDGLFNRPPYNWPTPSFWRRHHHDKLVERWAEVVGPENLTVVMVDQRDRGGLLRTVEQLVGLPENLLQPDDHVNRSLTYAETELIRQLNVALREREWTGEQYRDVVRMGVVHSLHANHHPSGDEQPIVTPKWALDRAAEIGAAAAERIEATGVHVIGDLSALASMPTTTARADQVSADEINNTDPTLPVKASVEAVLGAIDAGVRREKAAKPANPVAKKAAAAKTAPAKTAKAGTKGAKPPAQLGRSAEPTELATVTTPELAVALAHRVRRRIKRAINRRPAKS